MRRDAADKLASLVILLSCAFLFWGTLELPHRVAYYPRAVLLTTAALGLFLLARSLAGLTGKDPESEIPKTKWLRRSLPIIGLTMGYILSLYILGYVPSTFLFIFIVMWLLGIRRKLVLLLTPAATVLILYIAFAKGLMIPMPAGIFQ